MLWSGRVQAKKHGSIVLTASEKADLLACLSCSERFPCGILGTVLMNADGSCGNGTAFQPQTVDTRYLHRLDVTLGSFRTSGSPTLPRLH